MSGFLRTASTFVHGAQTLPGRYYTSQDVLAEEIERIFLQRWFWVGRADELTRPGEYFLFERFGESVIVLRDRHGQIRAFYNVCRHRGTRLCEATKGQFRETIQCPYHAWTYSIDGRLVGAPHMQDAIDFDKSDYPLRAVPVQEWNGWIFLSFAEDPAPVEHAFAPMLERLARFKLPNLERVARHEYRVQANWKLILQNYSECLHCPTIHPELSRVLPYQSGANDLFEGDILGGYMEIMAPNESATSDGRACGVPIGDLTSEDFHRAYYYTLLPNMMLSVHPDYVNYYSVWPLAADQSVVITEWLQHPNSRASGWSPKGAIEFWDVTNRQDWHICELSQRGISSRAYVPGPFSPRESIPAAWDRAYLAAMGRETSGS